MKYEYEFNFDQVSSTDTKIANSFFDLGLQYEKRNRYDLAVENYRKSLDYDPTLSYVKLYLKNLLHNEFNATYSPHTYNLALQYV